MKDENVKVLRCPYCGAPLKPNQNQCSYCGSYIIYEDDDVIAIPEIQEKEYIRQDEAIEEKEEKSSFIDYIISIIYLKVYFEQIFFLDDLEDFNVFKYIFNDEG